MEESNKTALRNKLEKETKQPYESSIVTGLISLAEADPELEKALEGNRKIGECFIYVRNKAMKQATGNCACVKDDVVFSWAAEFYKMPEEEYKKLGKSETKKPVKEDKKVVPITEVKDKPKAKKPKAPDRNPVPKKETKKKPDDDQMAGQMDIFSFIK